jgi:pilus assembly protein Flp/PilA
MVFALNHRGQGLVEYALILMLVAIIVIVILAIMGPAIGNMFSNVVNNI